MPKKDTPFVEKVFYFALNYLRYIIIITQLVVIGVFFYRFQVDQKIIDLKEAVDQKKEIVNIVLPLLNEASRIDKKSTEINSILNRQNTFSSMISYMLSIFPETINLTSFETTNNSLKISGIASDPKHLQLFYDRLKKEKKFSGVELQTIKRIDSGFSFIIALNTYAKK
jgi:hypothetical protein